MLKTKSLRLIIVVYWVLLIYIVAALVWWFIALQRQNEIMTELLIAELKKDDLSYVQKADTIENIKARKTAQYVGEGVTFLALISIGAVFVFRATRRQLRLSQQQQNFMMAITHELKTPIAIAKLNLETLQKRNLDEHQQERLITISLQEVNRLNILCNNILLSSQLDSGNYKVLKNKVNISNLAKQVVADFEQRNPGTVFTKVITGELCITGEELLLELLFSNLFENAIKYSPADSIVTVLLHKDKKNIQFVLKDEGNGIANKEKSKIFEKFYRIGNESTRTAKGTGLGLYLCRQIAKDHNATIKVTDNEPNGSVFTVTFKS